MNTFLFELIGTCFLILLGDGVVANVVLNKTKGNNGGWIVITFGWAIAVFVAVYIAASHTGAHLNPAVTLALASIDKLPWAEVPVYIGGQFAGAMLGALLVWVTYKKHFDETADADLKLAVFCTGPAIRSSLSNLITEIIGTFALVFGVLYIAGADVKYNGTLQQIIEQKWIASWTAAQEAWFDYRRTGFPELKTGPQAKRSVLPVRFYYMLDERNLNKTNTESAMSKLETTPYSTVDGKNSPWSKPWVIQGTGKPW
mgnify:CR=1 FL=1